MDEGTPRTFDVGGEEIWIVDPNGHGARRLAREGGFPSWSGDSKRLYFNSRKKEGGRRYLYRISIEDPNAKPERLLPTAYYGVVSPDEKYVAHNVVFTADKRPGIQIAELPSGKAVSNWKGPLGERGFLMQWSPNGRELSIGGYDESDLGLWIYDLDTQTASKALNGPVTAGVWSPDRNRMAFDVRGAFWEVWIADLDSTVSTTESLGSGWSTDEHYEYLTNLCTRTVHANALDADNTRRLKRLLDNLGSRFSSQYAGKMYVEALETLGQYSRIDDALSNLNPKYRGPIDLLPLTAELQYRVGKSKQADATLEKFRVKCRKASNRDYFKYLIKAEKLLAGAGNKAFDLWDCIEKKDLMKASGLLADLKREPPDDDPYIAGRIRSAGEQLVLAHMDRALTNERNGQYDKAVADLESLIKIDPNHVSALNLFAWLKATCADGRLRDGTVAIEKASRACELTNWKEQACLDTLAAAYAEAGDYEEAVKWQEEATKNLPERLRPGTREEYEARLELYRRREPYHQQYLWPEQLIAHYTFDKVEGGKVIDSSSHGIDGTLHGDAQIIEDPERGKVLKLDGDDDWVDCGNDVRFDITDQITIAAWIKTNKLDKGWQAIIKKGALAWRLQRYRETDSIEFSCSGLQVEGQKTATGYLFGKMNINDGKWHHLAGVFDGRHVILYVDGKRDVLARAAGRILTNMSKVFIGANSYSENSNPGEWNGLIDDVRIYSYGLSEAEVKRLHGDHGSGL